MLGCRQPVCMAANKALYYSAGRECCWQILVADRHSMGTGCVYTAKCCAVALTRRTRPST